ncbi:MAG: threonine synthase [Thermoleophilia bacterium]|nr:threonine synthase [Thermoleophilia bacterium]MDH3724987.1 threonine synthase [Thermoleophilia bacterium]
MSAALIERYRAHLPVTDATPVVSLGEGDTPLVDLPRLSERLELDIYAKYEGMNPTGSFKDRGMTMALSKALEDGAEAVICASTGNTSASAAAYATRAGMRCAVLIPDGKIALGKLAQALAHGARVIAIDGSFDDALRIVRELVERTPIALVNSLNPFRLEGQKTAAFEVCDTLGDAPDALCIPVGNAGNVSAYAMGFAEYHEAGTTSRMPRLYGFQAAGAAPLVEGHTIEKPETIATAIRIGNPARGQQALDAMNSSGGRVAAVTDEDILAAYALVASTEGVFCEPSSAASIAGVIAARERGELNVGERVVCVLTGHGLKDPDTAIAESPEMLHLPAEYAPIEDAIIA